MTYGVAPLQFLPIWCVQGGIFIVTMYQMQTLLKHSRRDIIRQASIFKLRSIRTSAGSSLSGCAMGARWPDQAISSKSTRLFRVVSGFLVVVVTDDLWLWRPVTLGSGSRPVWFIVLYVPFKYFFFLSDSWEAASMNSSHCVGNCILNVILERNLVFIQ